MGIDGGTPLNRDPGANSGLKLAAVISFGGVRSPCTRGAAPLSWPETARPHAPKLGLSFCRLQALKYSAYVCGEGNEASDVYWFDDTMEGIESGSWKCSIENQRAETTVAGRWGGEELLSTMLRMPVWKV